MYFYISLSFSFFFFFYVYNCFYWQIYTYLLTIRRVHTPTEFSFFLCTFQILKIFPPLRCLRLGTVQSISEEGLKRKCLLKFDRILIVADILATYGSNCKYEGNLSVTKVLKQLE